MEPGQVLMTAGLELEAVDHARAGRRERWRQEGNQRKESCSLLCSSSANSNPQGVSLLLQDLLSSSSAGQDGDRFRLPI